MGDKDGDIRISNTGFLPIVSAYAARIQLVEEIDRLLHCQMEGEPRQGGARPDPRCTVREERVVSAGRRTPSPGRCTPDQDSMPNPCNGHTRSRK